MYAPLLFLSIHNGSYTSLSIVNAVWAYLWCFEKMVYMLYINHMVIMISFHISYLTDREIFKKFQEYCKIKSKYVFWSINFLAHVAPTIFYKWYIVKNQIEPPSPHLGIITLMYHVLWKCRQVGNTWLLDDVYVKTYPQTWYLCWTTAIAVHLLCR